MISVKKRREIKVFLVTASIGIVVLGGQQVLADAASEMVNPKDKVLVGYWHNWKSTGKDGYKGGSSADFNLSSTQEGYLKDKPFPLSSLITKPILNSEPKFQN